jgi:hypothetical protein
MNWKSKVLYVTIVVLQVSLEVVADDRARQAQARRTRPKDDEKRPQDDEERPQDDMD